MSLELHVLFLDFVDFVFMSVIPNMGGPAL